MFDSRRKGKVLTRLRSRIVDSRMNVHDYKLLTAKPYIHDFWNILYKKVQSCWMKSEVNHGEKYVPEFWKCIQNVFKIPLEDTMKRHNADGMYKPRAHIKGQMTEYVLESRKFVCLGRVTTVICWAITGLVWLCLNKTCIGVYLCIGVGVLSLIVCMTCRTDTQPSPQHRRVVNQSDIHSQ